MNLRSDVYEGEEHALIRGDFTVGTLPGPSAPGRIDLAGHNVLVNWRRTFASDSDFGVQVYYDYTDRQIPGSFNEARDTWNVAWQHDLADRGRHDVQWGADLRSTSDDIGNTLFATFMPASRSDQTISAFVQDRIELRDERLYLTLGAKLEHNDYTGEEVQPNVRVSWFPSDRHMLWGAVSRAVRVPARLNTDLELFAPVGLIAGCRSTSTCAARTTSRAKRSRRTKPVTGCRSTSGCRSISPCSTTTTIACKRRRRGR